VPEAAYARTTLTQWCIVVWCRVGFW